MLKECNLGLIRSTWALLVALMGLGLSAAGVYLL